MARLESVAVAGYYPFPESLYPQLTRMVAPIPGPHGDAWLDPCAGEAAALCALIDASYPRGGKDSPRNRLRVYTIELEGQRGAHVRSTLSTLGLSYAHTLHHVGDALRVNATRDVHNLGVSCLYLNPPYDTDRQPYGRLEERFLRRFEDTLIPGGVLLFVVPAHALTASAVTLAKGFQDVEVYRFPDTDYAAFKQVVLRAVRRDVPLEHPDPETLALVREGATSPLTLPTLDDVVYPFVLPTPPEKEIPTWRRTGDATSSAGECSLGWEVRELDLQSIRELARPWHMTLRKGGAVPVHGIIPDSAGVEALKRRYPVAVTPKPAHLAAAIAAGLFNGERIDPEDAASTAPPLLVKGVFTREWRTVDVKELKDGGTRETQEENPKLEVTVLDLRRGAFSTLKAIPEPSGTVDPVTMTTGDLLTQYGPSLMGVMRAQCPVLHDPEVEGANFPLKEPGRPLYEAQATAARAIVRLLGGPGVSMAKRRSLFAYLLGEIGVGKSSSSLVAAYNVGGNTILVMMPPHLLAGWTDEVRVTLPGADVVVLDSVASVDALAARRAAGDKTLVVAIMSRETAKLGHAWEGVAPQPCACTRPTHPKGPRPANEKCIRCHGKGVLPAICPRCHTPTPDYDLAARRAHCEGNGWKPSNPDGVLALDLASILRGHAVIPCAAARFPGPGTKSVNTAIRRAFDRAQSAVIAGNAAAAPVLLALGLAEGSPEYRIRASTAVAVGKCEDSVHAAGRLLAATDPRAPGWEAALAVLLTCAEDWRTTKIRAKATRLYGLEGDTGYSYDHSFHDVSVPNLLETDTDYNPELRPKIGSAVAGDPGVVNGPLQVLLTGNVVEVPCGEPLYQAVPRPRRTPLATYISRRHPRLFDVLLIDEAHEVGNDGSAQERAAHRLTALGLPTVYLTGSLVNGYASHLYANLWAVCDSFRARYPRDGRGRFAARYGYRRRIVEADGKIKEFGSVTDRVETSGVRDAGDAPGVQPTAILEWVLPWAVTLHKSDLKVSIPDLTTSVHMIDPGPALLGIHRPMLQALMTRLRKDNFTELSGALMGALSEAPSHLDRATRDTGNTPEGDWVVKYPDTRSELLTRLGIDPEIHRVAGLPNSTILPKEAWLLDEVEMELSEGRSVMVLPWHKTLYPRLARLLRERTGVPVSVLDAEKVNPGARQGWITKELNRGCRILVTNPVAIQTGLNCLTAFSTEIWMQNPMCNPIIFRQATGRVDRLGQTRRTRAKVAVYKDTAQAVMHALLLQKVAVSQSTDGHDARSALQAAGVGESGALTSLSLGKVLFDLLDGKKTLAPGLDGLALL